MLQSSGAIAAIRNPDNDAFDVSSAISPSVQLLFNDATQQWLSPVEPGSLGPSALQFVGMPNVWLADTSLPAQVVFLNGRLTFPTIGSCVPGVRCERLLQIVDEKARGLAALTEPSSVRVPDRVVPSDRTGARATLSAKERAVYLAGGRRPSGVLTGEIWRYSLDAREWLPLLATFDAPAEVEVASDAAADADVRFDAPMDTRCEAAPSDGGRCVAPCVAPGRCVFPSGRTCAPGGSCQDEGRARRVRFKACRERA